MRIPDPAPVLWPGQEDSLGLHLANIIGEHGPPGSRKFNGALSSVGSERLPYKRPRGDANRGKKSYKSNWDCTICRSCREAVTGPVALE